MLKASEPKTVSYAYLVLLVINLLPLITFVPVSIQLFVNSIACIYIGSYRGIIILQEHELSKEKNDKIEKMTAKDAYMFPVYGSVVLFSLYMVFKHFDKTILNYLLTIHFTFFGFLSLIQLISYHVEKFFPDMEKVNVVQKTFEINLKFYKKTLELALTKSELIAAFIAIGPTLIYMTTKTWLTNNLFGIAFSICGIESLILPNYKVGFILLWGLFFYDIFWVYGTDVMLTVAKSVDAPIKLIFPINLYAEPPTFSMLGLGDIVIPGIFIALCLKFDIDKAIAAYNKGNQVTPSEQNATVNPTTRTIQPKTPYFTWCMVGYALGIVLTFQAMIIFNHAQPALLFLVPCCTLSVALLGFLKKEIQELINYDEENIRKQMKEEERKK